MPNTTQTQTPTIVFMNTTLELTFARYRAAPQTAIQLYDAETGEPWCTASVCLPDQEQAPDEVFIKNWSENEGILDALVAGGIVEDTGRVVRSGFAAANVCRLLVSVPEAAHA